MYRHFFRNIAISLVITLLAVVSCSSDRNKVRRKLNGMMDSAIVLPDDISCIRNGSMLPAEEADLCGKRLIVFVDSTECSRCRIENFARYQEFLARSEDTKAFKVIFLLSIEKKSHDEIVDFLLLTEPNYPVYIDEKNDFRRLNPTIPDDVRFHTIFVDEAGKALLVGDPMANASIRKLFDDVINE